MKPLHDSFQFFFLYDWRNYNKNRNRNTHNFKGNEFVQDNTFAKEYGQVYKGINYGAYGIIKNPFEFVDSVDFGANISPKAIQEKAVSPPSVTPKEVRFSQVSAPEVPNITVHAPNVTPPTPKTLVTPTAPNINVSAPAAISPLEQITVAEIAPLNINVTTPTISEPLTIAAPTVQAPATPDGFTPRLITPPVAPKDIIVNPPTINPPSLTGGGANPHANKYYWWNGNDGAISQISLKKGTFDIKPDNNIINVQSYDAVAFGTINPLGVKPIDGEYTVNQRFFHTLLNVPYSEYSLDVEINVNRNNFEVINLETEGTVQGNLSNRVAENLITQSKADTLKSYQTYSGIKGENDTELLFINKGKVNLNAEGSTYIFITSHNDGNLRTNYLDNEGTIKAAGQKSVIIKHTPDTNQAKAWIYSNNGNMIASGKESVVYAVAYKYLGAGRAAFVNEGNIEVSGEKAIGVFLPKDSTNSKMRDGYLVWLKKPIKVTGKGSMGFVAQNTGIMNGKNLVKFEITGEEAIGILQDVEGKGTTKTAGIISIEGGSKNIGIYGNQGKLELVKPDNSSGETLSSIDMKGGSESFGILADNESIIDFAGNAKITGGTGQKLAVAKAKGIINLKEDVEIGTDSNYIENSVSLYGTDNGSKIILEKPDNSKFFLKGNSVAAYAKNSAKITMSRTNLSTTSTIDIESMDNKGIGLFASEGGVIDADKHYMKVKNGSVGISSIKNNSLVNFRNGKLSYNGNGYAIYSDGQGKVDLSGTTIELEGKSTAFDVDLTGNLPITLDSNTRISANSDDVIVFNLKHATNLTTIGGIENTIKTAIQTKLPSGTNLSNLFDGSTSTKYKVAAVDGGNIIIGNLDKTGISTDTAPEKKDGFQFYNRFLGQRLVATTNSGSTISAKLNNSQAVNFNNQVVGLEMNSSKNASAVTETAIKLVDSTIQAERTDTGAGAVGAFINYGQVDIDSGSKIEVEQTKNNTGAVGVYSVNGSEVSNKGTIAVGGDKSIGVLAMAYRLDSSNNKVIDEFGTGALGQGKIKVETAAGSNITMSGKNSIGIFADNNKDSATADSEHLIVNKGTITVGKSDSGNAIAIYGNNATIKPESGTLKIGENAIGIYAKDSIVGEDNKALGTVNYTADGGIGIYLKDDGNTSKTILKGTTLALTESDGTWNKKIGIFTDLATDTTLKTKIEVGSLNNVTAYYTQNKNLTVNADGKINENSVGITGAEGKKLTYGDGSADFNFEIGKNSTGILAKKSGVDLKEKATLKLTGESAIGIYSNGVNGTSSNITIAGKINPDKDKTIGIYAVNGPTVDTKDGTFMDFGTNATNSIGLYLAGSKWIHDFNGTSSGTLINFTSDHTKKNIFAYMQGYKDGANVNGSSISLGKEFKVSPTGTASATARTIGIYMDTTVKGGSGEFANNILTGTGSDGSIAVEKKGIGVYAKNGDTSGNKTNIFKVNKLSSKGEGSVGIYTDGNLSLTKETSDTMKITAEDKGIGVYGNKGKITVSNDDTEIELKNQGTGIYLTNGSYLDSGKLTLKNSTGSAAAGVYYIKGSSNSQVTHNTELTVNDGNNILALYVDGGINLKNTKPVNITKNQGNVAAFITGNSKFTNDADITLEGTGINLQQALGIYVQSGETINNAGRTIKVKDEVTGSLSVGMAAVKSAGTQATVNNAGTIEVMGDTIGMYVADHSSGTNSGTITAKDSGTMKAIGAYAKGANASFKNTGTVSSDNIALALENTTVGKVISGTLKLIKNNAVGVYAKNSIIDFDLAPATTKEKTVALFAQGNTKIRKTVTSAAGKGHVGVYVKDSNVKFETGSKVVVNNGEGTDFGTGIFTAKEFSGDIKTDIQQNGDKTIGLFLGNDVGAGSTVNYTGTIGVGTGIGVFIPGNSKFVSTNTTFDVNGGTAVFLKGGTVDLGSAGTARINFGSNGGTAVYQDGGTIITGTGLTVNGSGSFLALKNADSTINSILKVGADGIGINAIYDASGSNHSLTLGSSGKIELNGNKATGIAASVSGLGSNKVTIKNEGTIKTISGTETVGIFTKGAHVENTASAKIDIGENGIGIYTTNDGADPNTTLTNKGEIILSGDEAIGILANKPKTTESFVGGKITGTKDTLTGIYVKESEAPTNVKDFTISLGTHAKGLVFDKGKDFTVNTTSANNKITIGDTLDKTKRGIGIAAIETGGTIEKTDVLVGTDSLGLYAKGKEVEFKTGMLKSSTGSSILAYADKKATIKLNTGPFEIAKNGLAIGANGGKVKTDTVTIIEVKGENGIGAFVVGDATDTGSISDKFEVKVKHDGGIGVYAKGKVTSFAKVKEIKGNHSKGYIFDNLADAATISDVLQLQDSNATGQIGIYAMGTGAGITTKGISVMGSGNIGLYNQVNQNLTNDDILTVTDSTSDKNSIGIYSDNRNESTIVRTITTKDAITVGKNSVGIYGKNIGIKQTLASKDITVDEKGIGLLTENTAEYYGKGNISVSGNLQVKDKGAVGIQASNADISVKGLTVGAKDSKGIYSTEKGNITVSDDITVGKNSIGIYKKGTEVESIQTMTGKTLIVGEKAYGIFAEKATVENKATVTVSKDGIGIYATGADLLSKGNITTGDSAIGLYLKSDGSKTLNSKGVHQVGNNKAIGLYADNANVEMKSGSSMTTGTNDSVGIFSKGTGNITTDGNITVGADSIGIYKKGTGNLKVGASGQSLSIADKGYGIYYIGNDKPNSKIESKMNIMLGKEAVGIYAKGASIKQEGDITVGETTIGSSGFSDPNDNKNSIGIFGDHSNITYKGHMVVDKPLSVGIYGMNGGDITLESGA
ncbi:autotransporter-associated N-terminal domain-containing protein, partial [Fusobacterium necrophorum]|uniref:autotransporter-associated N-terminal domain-containing protein n=1 Tax=Fusobacterium necrophorum TaxID=859 RepID=UPI00115FE8A3